MNSIKMKWHHKKAIGFLKGGNLHLDEAEEVIRSFAKETLALFQPERKPEDLYLLKALEKLQRHSEEAERSNVSFVIERALKRIKILEKKVVLMKHQKVQLEINAREAVKAIHSENFISHEFAEKLISILNRGEA